MVASAKTPTATSPNREASASASVFWFGVDSTSARLRPNLAISAPLCARVPEPKITREGKPANANGPILIIPVASGLRRGP
jgi:hypothetical protein